MVSIDGIGGKAEAMSRFTVLGVCIDACQITDVVQCFREWIGGRQRGRMVAVTGMHGIVEAQHEESFRRVLNSADLVVPDGMPLVWMGRRQGFELPRRVYGPELMEDAMRHLGPEVRHFLYGGSPDVVERLESALRSKFSANIVGAYSPPFRALESHEETEIAEMISASRADIVWVGLSTPKQEKWMAAMRDRVSATVMVGVGAAFDFHAGEKKMAPRWMQENGFEWLYRLGSEPRRLWRRYLLGGGEFVLRVLWEEIGRMFTPRSAR